MVVVGMDIGYSNLKLTYGKMGGKPVSVLRPAGAAPADRFGPRIDGKAHDDFLHVQVGGRPFVAGVSPDRAEMWSRTLHADYSSSESYKALFHAGLLLSGADRIERLVTGLPVSQCLDENRKAFIVAQMQGTHQVTPKRSVTVETVKVIPQPIGGLLDYVAQTNTDIGGARVLVIDPGFFSVDWVVVADQAIDRRSSGTSVSATSVVLEEAAKLINSDFGGGVSTEGLENAIRQARTSVLSCGQPVDIAQYIEAAAKVVTPVVISEIKKSLRANSSRFDLVLLVGGGAMFYREAVADAFPGLPIATPSEPELSNARGFWLMGCA